MQQLVWESGKMYTEGGTGMVMRRERLLLEGSHPGGGRDRRPLVVAWAEGFMSSSLPAGRCPTSQ